MERLMIGKATGVLIALIAAAGALAQDRWRYAGTSPEYDVYLDSATLSRSGSNVDAWFEHRYKPQGELSKSLNMMRIDCTRRTVAVLSSVQYGKDSKVKLSSTDPGPQSPIIPGSMGELAWGAACPEEAEPFGLEQVRMLGERLRRADPAFDRKISEMSATISGIQAVLPPTLWAAAIESEWRKLK